MKIAKEFRWEMGHRLQFHNGKCKNLHGHSYKLLVEVEGNVEGYGMVMDYYDMKKVIGPIVDELDHSFMVNKNDPKLLSVLEKLNSQKIVVDFETTAENLCGYFLQKIKQANLPANISRVMVKVFETENTYAEDELDL